MLARTPPPPPEPGRHIDLSDAYAGLPPMDLAGGPRRPPSPAMQAWLDDYDDHARRWVQAKCDTLAELGCTDAPCRDRGVDLWMERTPLSLRGSL